MTSYDKNGRGYLKMEPIQIQNKICTGIGGFGKYKLTSVTQINLRRL